MATYILLAYPGERHEDVIPIGIYTYQGLRRKLLNPRDPGESGEYYLFVLKPDVDWPSRSEDCDLVVSWSEDEPGVFSVGYDQVNVDDVILQLRDIEEQKYH